MQDKAMDAYAPITSINRRDHTSLRGRTNGIGEKIARTP